MTTEKYYNVHGIRPSGARTPELAYSDKRKAEKRARDLVDCEGCVTGWVFRWVDDVCRIVYKHKARGWKAHPA